MKRSSEERKLDLIELVLALVALAAIVGAAMATLSGCIIQGDEEEWRELVAPHYAALTNKIANAVSGQTNATSSASYPQVAQVADEVDFAQLQWAWGGFNGKNALPVDGCEIAELRVGGGKMSYKWQHGGCELLGAADRGDANCIAALFVHGTDGSWRGGKFEWISTSRTSRSLGNIEGGYHGWPGDAVEKATACAFVIVSKNGSKRSNVIMEVK